MTCEDVGIYFCVSDRNDNNTSSEIQVTINLLKCVNSCRFTKLKMDKTHRHKRVDKVLLCPSLFKDVDRVKASSSSKPSFPRLSQVTENNVPEAVFVLLFLFF